MDSRSRSADTPTETPVTRLEFDIEWPPKHVAAYLVDETTPILVDAGAPGEDCRDEMVDALAAAGYAPSDIEAVVVTHPHSDHIGQVPLLREAGATVHAPAPVLDQLRRDADALRDRVHGVALAAGLDEDRATTEAERAVESLRRDRRLLEPDDTNAFAFGDVLAVAGYEFDPIHTPGHQIHHASLETTLDDQRVLFSGDALIEPFRAAALDVGLDDGVYGSVEHFYQAMDRFAERSVDQVFPGHGPQFADAMGAVDATRSALDDLVANTREAVDAIGPASPVDIVEHRFENALYPAQLLDALGALGTLEDDGVVTHDVSDGVRQYRIA